MPSEEQEITDATSGRVLVADVDLEQRTDWLTLFPFFATRRPDTYGALVEPTRNPRHPDGTALNGGIPGLAP